jgi:hypothetical protein
MFVRRRPSPPGVAIAAVALVLIVSGLGIWDRRAEAAFAQRVDTGGTSAYTDLGGDVWAADQPYVAGGFGFVGGSGFTTTADIADTSDDPLYRTNRNAASLEYRFDLPNGSYDVLLRFAEIQRRAFAVGARVFDVTIEGATVLNDLDVFAAVGANTALDRTFAVIVTDGTLNVALASMVGNAMVSAIAVESATIGDFTFTATPPSVTMSPGGTTNLSTEVAFLDGFTSTETDLSVSGLPPGVTGVFAPDPLTHEGMSQFTLTGNGSAADGTYPLTLIASAEGITHTQGVTLVVSSTPDFGLSASPATQSVGVGGSTTFTVDLTSLNGYRRTVTLTASGLPAGATGIFSPVSIRPPATSTLTVSTTGTVAQGVYPLAVTGTSGSRSHAAPITLIVGAAGGVWGVGVIGSTGVANNSVVVGPGRSDGVNRVYVGTVNTGRVMELSWNGTTWGAPVDVGGSPSGLEIHNLTMGPGRNDGRTRIYACSLDGNLYEISFSGSTWTQTTVGVADPPCTHAVVGAGRNDGVNRLYATRNQIVWEYTWTGTSWSAVQVGSVSRGIVHGIDLGRGRGGTVNHLYIASSATGTYEATFSGSAWSMVSMGDDGDVRNVSLGAGRNDGVTRVYAGVSNGVIREFTWTGTAWSEADVNDPIGSVIVHAYVRAGRNDGRMRVYGATGDGSAYEFSWNGSSWTIVDMGGGSAYLYGFFPGTRPGDSRQRLYGAAFDGHVYEFTFG